MRWIRLLIGWKSCEIDGENVGLDDFDVGPPLCGAFAETGGEGCVGFDSDDARRVLCEEFGHFAMARADFEPCRICVSRKRARDALSPRGIVKKVLAKLLTRHEKRSLASFGRTLRLDTGLLQSRLMS